MKNTQITKWYAVRDTNNIEPLTTFLNDKEWLWVVIEGKETLVLKTEDLKNVFTQEAIDKLFLPCYKNPVTGGLQLEEPRMMSKDEILKTMAEMWHKRFDSPYAFDTVVFRKSQSEINESIGYEKAIHDLKNLL